MQTPYRLGIDAGGTFTDFVLAHKQAGTVEIYKALSTPGNPTEAIKNGLQLITDDLNIQPRDLISQCDLCINGTTVGLNALIQHTGAKVGLICTKGHEDSIEIRLGHKEDGYRYDPEYPPAVMLAPRYLRCGVRERVISNGSIRTAMQEEDVRDACRLFLKEKVESVAISFLWSVLNNSHELRAADIVREMMPNVILTVGSELYPQIREYTRTSTAITNAYLAPIIKSYVAAIDGYFQELGAISPVRYFQSNGGLAEGKTITDQSVYAINSGPASAPQAALAVCKPFGHTNVITVDMGGTSFDITLARNGVTNLNKDIDFLRYRIGVPMIQVETLGAGGGSIGWIDDLGLLQMGPQSAGSDPGPACYDRGGIQPTVSDANLVLGYLNPEGLVGGRLPLNREKSWRAIEEKIARPLNISVEKAAHGMFTIVNNNMVNGIRRVSVERGYDPRDFVLVAAGGATGAHITALATEMGIDTVIASKLSSGLCAYGQIISDVKHNYMATVPVRLEGDDVFERINTTFDDIEAKGISHLKSDGFDESTIDIQRSMEMRYVGQIHECTVEIDSFRIDSSSIEQVKNAFHDRHEQLFTYAERQNPVELVNVEATLYGRVERPSPAELTGGVRVEEAIKGERSLIFSGDEPAIKVPVYDGARIGAGNRIVGPAVIEEETATLIIQPHWQVELHKSASFVITRVT